MPGGNESCGPPLIVPPFEKEDEQRRECEPAPKFEIRLSRGGARDLGVRTELDFFAQGGVRLEVVEQVDRAAGYRQRAAFVRKAVAEKLARDAEREAA